MALAVAPDWRWLLDRADSPWYPTMRLFRQKEPGNWEPVFAEIAAALAERVGTAATLPHAVRKRYRPPFALQRR